MVSQWTHVVVILVSCESLNSIKQLITFKGGPLTYTMKNNNIEEKVILLGKNKKIKNACKLDKSKGTLYGSGYNCNTNKSFPDGIWNKVSYYTKWIKNQAKRLGEELCFW